MSQAPDARARRPGPPRHELPVIDAAALDAARSVDRTILACRAIGADRWVRYLEPIPDALRDAPIGELRSVALRARAAIGPKDSILEILGPDVTVPLRDAIDGLLRLLAREAARPGGQ
ncbi:MAG TPA: hypothetical protein VLA23_05065 [Candidatus Limnocylindrales bacterium]|nr:hypothetical protein [Candidatus Limnocylindrales bacterium]